jgi:hypothetical protein
VSGKSQTALERYKAHRMGLDSDEPKSPSSPGEGAFQWKYVRVLVLMVLLLGVAWPLLPHRTHPLQLTYEIDLTSAPEGTLVITMIAEGTLPRSLDLEFPPGVFGDQDNGVSINTLSAHAITPDGSQGRHLITDQTRDGWHLKTAGLKRAGFIYQVDLSRTAAMETDIRRYISTPVSGGVRAAGFEIFLEPVDVPVEEITVTIHNPRQLPLLVPWPALVRGEPENTAGPGGPLEAAQIQDAHLGFGEGYLPVDPDGNPLTPPGEVVDRSPAAVPVPTNLFYHPHDLADLNNSLLICGDIRTLSDQARDCVIQYATDRQWLFDDRRVLELVRKIARAEIAFFGSAPTDQITVLLAANEVISPDGFDVYGVHTGSSVLVMIDAETNWGMLQEQAASVIAHEMFHGWLGEAITQNDPATLWFTEGATTWYSARILTAAGIWDPDHARQILSDRLENDYARSDLLGRVSIAEAASQVMVGRDVVRYAYAGGAAACMALDEHLTGNTGQQAPLDLVLRHLYQNRDGQGLTRAKLEAAVTAVTGQECGQWLDTFVYGHQALPPVTRYLTPTGPAMASGATQ